MKQPSLYTRYAEWWPLLSAPSEYAEEAAVIKRLIIENSETKPRTVLELGSGGGSNAFHLKKHFKMTLVDLSKHMLKVSKALNPTCEHIQGDMRKLRLNRMFDVVFIHDAIDYMTTKEQLREAVVTAYAHCRPGGLVLLIPDWTSETFKPSADHGGSDRGPKGLRYLEWDIDEDPNDSVYSFYMVYLFKDGNTVTGSSVDHHLCGLFSRKDWLGIMKGVGLRARMLPYELSDFEKEKHYLFVGTRSL